MLCGGNRATSLVCQQSECGPSRTSFVVLLPTTGDLKGGIVPSATCARKLFMFSFLRGCVMRQPHRWQHQKRWLFSDPGLGTHATCSTDDAVSSRSGDQQLRHVPIWISCCFDHCSRILTAVVFGECSEHAKCSRDDAREREKTEF